VVGGFSEFFFIETNYVSYPFPRNEPEILEKFLGASFRVERVKRHCERLNLRQPTNLQSEQRAKKSECQRMVGNHQFIVLERALLVFVVLRRVEGSSFLLLFLKKKITNQHIFAVEVFLVTLDQPKGVSDKYKST